MLIEDFLEKIEGDSRKQYFSFETFILNILKVHIEGQNKKFLIVNNINGIGDAIAEDGFDSFEGNTVVEIKYRLDRLPSMLIIDQLIRQLNRSENSSKIKNILIINTHQISPINKTRIEEKITFTFPNVKIFIWGPENINKILNKHKKQAESIADNLFSLRLENAVNKDIGDWQKDRDGKIELLKEVYDRAQFSIFLGAGVSSSAGMPDWNTLLNSLFVSYLTKEFNEQTNILDLDIKEIVERLNEIDEPSALMAARYLRKGLSKEVTEIKEFKKTITDNLYKLRDPQKNINSDLIKAIASLSMPKRTGAKIRSVITYNFDDLLERELESKSIQYHSIYTDNESYHPDELPIYHVHGFLPENSNNYERLEKSTLVFSEEGYHQIYTDAYHWSNLVQLASFRENGCLMIGLSMTDPNLRRLLDIAARNSEIPKHFALMRRMTLDTFAYSKSDDGSSNQIINNLKGAEQFLDRHHKLNEEIMRELGVTIIWFNKFEDIPVLLNKLSSL